MADFAGIDRRLFERIAHPPEVLVAPWTDREVPTRESFRSVGCKDISLCGFAYFTRERPECDRIVALFGPPSKRFSVVAEIVHVTPTEADGQDAFTVGCRITERIDNPCKDADGALS